MKRPREEMSVCSLRKYLEEKTQTDAFLNRSIQTHANMYLEILQGLRVLSSKCIYNLVEVIK